MARCCRRKNHEKSAHKIDIVDATLLAMIPMLAEPVPQVYAPKLFFLEA